MQIGILGAAGRMGQMLMRELLSKNHAATLGAAIDHGGSWALGKDAGDITGLGPCGVKITADAEAAFAQCDALIDFTTPEGAEKHAALSAKHGKPLVVGTTGLLAAQEAALAAAAKKSPVLVESNMSLGVALAAALVEQAAARLGPDAFDIEIFEAHHRHKTDAPSGTALLLGRAAAKGRGVKLNEAIVQAREGQTGARKAGTIGMSVFRGGDVIGDHVVTFAGTGERIEIAHRASDRAIFARGAIRAALWLKGKPPGFYSVKDVLGF